MADSKITALPAIASVAGEDLLVIVDDPAGTPATTKGTVTQVGDQILARADLAELIRDTIGTALVDGTGIDVVVDDGAETITINSTATSPVSDTAYASSWDGDTTTAPSKNAVHDKFEGLIHPGYVSARWYTPFYRGRSNNGAASSSGTIYYHPIYITRAITISDLGCSISNASAGGNVKLAIYANDPSTCRPTGTPLAETGNISTTSTGLVSADITGANVTLAAGMYWGAFWMDNTTAILRCIERLDFSIMPHLVGSATLANIVDTSNLVLNGLSSAETFGTWPDASGETFTEVRENRVHALLFMKAA